MRRKSLKPLTLLAFATVALVSATAQTPELQQRVAEVKQAAAQNKEALSHYSWQQQQTTAIKGNVKNTKLFQVHLGPGGQPQKVELQNMPSSSGGGGGPIKRRVVEKKKAEYQDYGEQIAALAQEYAQPDPARIQRAFQQRNLTVGPAGVPGQLKILIRSYVKPNDQFTLIFDRQAKAIRSLQVATYLNDPKDVVNIGAQFSHLPDGTSHVATMQLNGVSKELLITMQNSNYQKII